MDDRPLFQDMDEAEDNSASPGDEAAEHAPVVGGMGVYPGSGATGVASGGMAPPVTGGAAEDAVRDLTEPAGEVAADDEVEADDEA